MCHWVTPVPSSFLWQTKMWSIKHLRVVFSRHCWLLQALCTRSTQGVFNLCSTTYPVWCSNSWTGLEWDSENYTPGEVVGKTCLARWETCSIGSFEETAQGEDWLDLLNESVLCFHCSIWSLNESVCVFIVLSYLWMAVFCVYIALSDLASLPAFYKIIDNMRQWYPVELE